MHRPRALFWLELGFKTCGYRPKHCRHDESERAAGMARAKGLPAWRERKGRQHGESERATGMTRSKGLGMTSVYRLLAITTALSLQR